MPTTATAKPLGQLLLDRGVLRREQLDLALAEQERGAGMGLRLAAFAALQLGGMVEVGEVEDSSWRARLVLHV